MQNEKDDLVQRERLMEEQLAQAGMPLMRAEAKVADDDSVTCPNCGAINESTSLYCEQCGAHLRDFRCPFCGAPMDEQTDYCERCHQYIDREHCSFCHARVSEGDLFCPECGSSLSGIECPVCHTIGKFGFCEACGTPLTDSARLALREAWQDEVLVERVRSLEEELEKLWLVRPVTNDQQREKQEAVMSLASRVKDLIRQERLKAAQQGGTPAPASVEEPEPEPAVCVMTEQDLQRKIHETQQALQEILNSMATQEDINPAHARNTAMARKPKVSRLAWKCNYKQALHTSPLGCACPQHGGKWVVMDGKSVVEDD